MLGLCSVLENPRHSQLAPWDGPGAMIDLGSGVCITGSVAMSIHAGALLVPAPIRQTFQWHVYEFTP